MSCLPFPSFVNQIPVDASNNRAGLSAAGSCRIHPLTCADAHKDEYLAICDKNKEQAAVDGSTTKGDDDKDKDKDKDKASEKTKDKDKIAGLNCDLFGGPDEATASEMVYWRDVPSDAEFTSPYAKYGPDVKYLTFEPDEGGWNNLRMSMETATALAHAMGRVLVLPPEQNIYLLGSGDRREHNRFTFKKFFPFDAISSEHEAVEVISMEEFLEREVVTGNLKHHSTGKVVFPPGNTTQFDGHGRTPEGKKLWGWLREVALKSTCDFSKGLYAFPKTPGPEGVGNMRAIFDSMNKEEQTHGLYKQYTDKPTPVDAGPEKRLKEMLSFRKEICLYDDHMQNAKVMHFMGDGGSGARMLVHFYAFLFFEDWRQDLWTKRYVRDHLRYIDEIQCAAARIVSAVRERARAYSGGGGGGGGGDGDDGIGIFDTMHVRRGDFQYQQTRIPAPEIYQNIKDLIPENTTVFVATDERDKKFFDPIREHYNLLFLDDFLHLVPDLNKNYYGMLDQRIASRGKTFVGVYYSTFTGYINRMRGYHTQKDKLEGYYELGRLNSWFYSPRDLRDDMTRYSSLKGPLWGREFPVAWRDLDHDLDPAQVVSR